MEIISEILHHILYLKVYFLAFCSIDLEDVVVPFLHTLFQVPVLFFSYILNTQEDVVELFLSLLWLLVFYISFF